VAAHDPDLGDDARLARPAVLAFEYAALHLAADDRRLDEHLRVDLASDGDGRVER
jgi:hypothetical protein